MLRKQSELVIDIVVSLLLLGQAIFGFLPEVVLRIIVLPFLLIVPGNALMGAFFPKARLQKLERYLYTIGLSLAVVILSGFVLNISHAGLQVNSWLIIVPLISLIASVIAVIRRWRTPASEPVQTVFYLPLRQFLILTLAVVLIVFAFSLSISPKSADNIQGYTSLWILPNPNNQPDAITVGIQSQELVPTQYRLQVTYNGQPVQAWPNLSLAPGDKWEQTITVPAGKGVVAADLYRSDNPSTVYRRVSVNINQ